MTFFSIRMRSIERKKYLDELVSLRNNGMIKVITGMCQNKDLYQPF
jgi:hypothetical protein